MIDIMLPGIDQGPHVERRYRRGQFLFRQGEAVTHMFFITAGEAKLERQSPDGGGIVLQRAKDGSFLAEASLFNDAYHCDAVAVTDLTARLFARSSMRRRFEENPAFAIAWATHLAGEIRDARARAEILSLKTVSERLDAWIFQNGGPPAKGVWKRLAQEIGTSPEALYREIARRRARIQDLPRTPKR